jgi:hypothetical protein
LNVDKDFKMDYSGNFSLWGVMLYWCVSKQFT